ncbi:MAG TPA: metallophosphoesterase [Actinomycetota bacterium]|nr:metallophosphoesterase [Actinomycetota bacterium]
MNKVLVLAVAILTSLSTWVAGVAEARLPAVDAAPGVAATAESGYFNFAVIGDFGTGGDEQEAVAQRMCKWRANHPFEDVFTTGDNIYDTGQKRRFDGRFWKPYGCLFDAGVKWHAILGNHDIIVNGGLYELSEPTFGMKARNFVVRRNGVRFVMVDSNALRMGWIRRHLRSKPDDRWTIVVFHHPVYSPSTAHGSTPGFRKLLNPLFRRRGVDLVLNGHDHLYSVTKPIKKIRYLVTGGGGRELYPCAAANFSAVCVERNHFVYVHAGRKRLRIRAVPAKGRVFHSFRTRGRA